MVCPSSAIDTFRAQVLTFPEMIPNTNTALWGLCPCQKAVTELYNSHPMMLLFQSLSIEVIKIEVVALQLFKNTKGENPVVATDATCFMSWIAKEYGLRLPRDYVVKETCSRSFGDKTDINKDVCW